MLKNSILKFLKLDGLIESLTGYVETRVELLKIEVREDIAKALAKLSFSIVLGFSFIVFLLFISIALALWVGESLGLVLGFTIVAVLYFLITLICIIFKKPIGRKLEKTFLDIVKEK